METPEEQVAPDSAPTETQGPADTPPTETGQVTEQDDVATPDQEAQVEVNVVVEPSPMEEAAQAATEQPVNDESE